MTKRKEAESMSIELMRIDDRLIHGQIVTAWAKNLNATTIWIVDDEVSKDDFLKDVMKMVAPPNTNLVITGTEDLEEQIEKFDNASENVLILVKVPEVAEKIFNAGMKKKELNVGGMGASKTRKKLFKNISASKDEIETLEKIRDSGVRVYFQITPNEKQTLI